MRKIPPKPKPNQIWKNYYLDDNSKKTVTYAILVSITKNGNGYDKYDLFEVRYLDGDLTNNTVFRFRLESSNWEYVQ